MAKEFIVDKDTGEVKGISEIEKYEIVKKELNELSIADDWLDKKEAYETAKYEFELVDKPFKSWLKEKMKEFKITRIYNAYLDAQLRKGYSKHKWNDKKVEEFIREHGGNPDDFRVFNQVDDTIAIKYIERE